MRLFASLLLLTLALPAAAGSPAIVERAAHLPADTAYSRLHAALEDNGFYVVFEPDMGKTLSGMADKLGADYNRNQLTTMRSLVFCNPRLTNRIANADPALLALCPLHLTLTHKAGVSTVYFVRPSIIAAGSPGAAQAAQLETDVVKVIEGVMHDQ